MAMHKNVFPMLKLYQVINFLTKIPTYVCERRMHKIISYQYRSYFFRCMYFQLNNNPKSKYFFCLLLTNLHFLIMCTCSSKLNFYTNAEPVTSKFKYYQKNNKIFFLQWNLFHEENFAFLIWLLVEWSKQCNITFSRKFKYFKWRLFWWSK
jgi:hypothetical protein